MRSEFKDFSIADDLADGSNDTWSQQFNPIAGYYIVHSCVFYIKTQSRPIWGRILLRNKDVTDEIFAIVDQGKMITTSTKIQKWLGTTEKFPIPQNKTCELIAIAYNETGGSERLIFSGTYEVLKYD